MAITCNLRYEIEGLENIHDNVGIVFSKHQSTWETLTLNFWFSTQSWVVKRELLWVPVFGWGVFMMDPIALDRGAGKKAIDQLSNRAANDLKKAAGLLFFLRARVLLLARKVVTGLVVQYWQNAPVIR